MRAGPATLHDAEDATMKAFGEMLRAVEPGKYSLAYVSKAAIHNFVKEKTRYGDRVRGRLDGPGHDQRAESAEDHALSEWEGERWCEDVLSELSPRQRQVMECLAAGLDNLAACPGQPGHPAAGAGGHPPGTAPAQAPALPIPVAAELISAWPLSR
jgi:hypothetical protein